MDTHTEYNDREDNDAGACTYRDAAGNMRPCRFDSAWITSARARGAIAQRLIDGYQGKTEGMMHQRLCEYMEDGMPPEVIEDVMHASATYARVYAILDVLASGQVYDTAPNGAAYA